MKSHHLIAAAALLDWLAGDPEWLPHPVRLMGSVTQAGETLLRRAKQSAFTELLAGAGLTLTVVASAYLGTKGTVKLIRKVHPGAATAASVFLAASCLATRNLVDEGRSVLRALEQADLPEARQRLARIVGRDTAQLPAAEIHRAVIETLAESACDGIIAPLFYMALGGVPLTMAYKAVNTLDSMIGHADDRYFYFGKAAARLDDVANYLPARATAWLIVLSSGSANRRMAWLTWKRDSGKHKSPNAGHPESAMAGALSVRLGGENYYAGERIVSPVLGESFPPATFNAAKLALRIVMRVSLLGTIAAVVLRAQTRAFSPGD